MGKSRQIHHIRKKRTSHVKLKPNTTVCDSAKAQWMLGKPIGAGGFGDIFLASKDVTKNVPADAPYVAKVELLSNGPLFVEMNFYLRVTKKELIEKWKKERKLKHLGIPQYHGFGSFTNNGERYRFLILDRFGPDIGSLFKKCQRRFKLKTVFNVGRQVLDILEYIHYYGYIHADIKGSNLLLGLGVKGEQKVYLLDYGLACLYIDRLGHHKEYNQDLRRAHDGTMEYTSRDAHVGAHSRRGDLEVLAYNMIQWLSGRLPWESDLVYPELVAEAKNQHMSNISKFLDTCFPLGNAPAALEQFLKYVAGLGFTTKPDYERLRGILQEGIIAAELPDDGKLDFTPIASLKISKRRGRGSDTENQTGTTKGASRGRSGVRKPCAPVQVCDRVTRQQSLAGRTCTLRSQQFDWVKILQSHPERNTKPKQAKPRPARRKVVEDIAECLQRPEEDTRANPTPAMLEFIRRREMRSPTPPETNKRHKRANTPDLRRRRANTPDLRRRRASTPAQRRSRNESTPSPFEPAPYTPAMEEVLKRRELGLTNHYEPPRTAMSARAERMKNREARKNAQDKKLDITPSSTRAKRTRRTPARLSDTPISKPTRTPTRKSLIAKKEPQEKPSLQQQNNVQGFQPISSSRSTRASRIEDTVKRPTPASRIEDTVKRPSPVRPETPSPTGSERSLSPVNPHPARFTRLQARCDPRFWKPITCGPWRPPTPPRKSTAESLFEPVKQPRKRAKPPAWRPPTPSRETSSDTTSTSSLSPIMWDQFDDLQNSTVMSRKRKYYDDSDFETLSESTVDSNSSLSSPRPRSRCSSLSRRTIQRPPTTPKYRQKSIAVPKVKRHQRREVSPSDIDFVPRLRSGKDTSDDFMVLHGRPASTPITGVKLFTGNQRLVSSMGRPLRPYYRLASLL